MIQNPKKTRHIANLNRAIEKAARALDWIRDVSIVTKQPIRSITYRWNEKDGCWRFRVNYKRTA